MLKASGAMAAATLTSRVLGMVREMVYYHFMGIGWVNDAFQYAFTVPNLFRRLLGEGALTAAFIPIFKEKEKSLAKLMPVIKKLIMLLLIVDPKTKIHVK